MVRCEKQKLLFYGFMLQAIERKLFEIYMCSPDFQTHQCCTLRKLDPVQTTQLLISSAEPE